MALASILGSAILPVVIIAAAGFLLGHYRGVEADALNAITIYVLAPALVVHSLATTELAGGTLARIVLGMVAVTLLMGLVAEALGRLRSYPEPVLSGFVLIVAFPNVGNFGIPLAEFAFGPTGRSTAIIATAVQGVLLYTIGVYVAARTGEGDLRANLRRVFSIPLVYAVVFALLARWLGVVPEADSSLMETLRLVGEAAIPVMLLVLGIQLATVRSRGTLARVGTASGLRLLVAPAVGLGIALGLGFADPTVARTFVLLCGAPAAVTTIVLVGAFGGDDGGEFVSAAVLATTVASVATVTALVLLLEAGVLL